MAPLLDNLLFGVALLSGVVLCWLGVHCYRQWDEPGVTAFGVFAVLLGVGGILSAVLGIVIGTPSGTADGNPLWSNVAVLSWSLATVPWLVFALQYTGKYTRLRRRTVALLAAPLGAIGLVVLASVTGWTDDSVILQIIGTFAVVHILFLVIIGVYLIVRTTHEYGHLSLVQGVSLGTAGFAPLFVLNITPSILREVSVTAAAGTHALAFVIPAGLLTFTVFEYHMFDSTPASGTVGEQAIARETDNLIFVVDQNERVIKLNPKAAEVFGVSQTEPLGEPISDILDVTLDELQEMETYERRAGISRQQFDPEVSAFTDQHGRHLGYIVSLHDVTERELRKQRLEVLNRVLRHNLRNSVDVIKSNAEVLAENGHSERTDMIIESAEDLADLGYKARSIDRFVSRQLHETERDLVAVTEEIIEERREREKYDDDIRVDLNGPESATLTTDWEALRAALDSAIGNAIQHAEAVVTVEITEYVTGFRITVTDDGPGVPDSEIAAIDAGSETPLQHGTGLGLWQIKWGIKKLNGTVAFENEDGTVVRMTVPDRAHMEV